jgi:hypothetical protein
VRREVKIVKMLVGLSNGSVKFKGMDDVADDMIRRRVIQASDIVRTEEG